MKDYGNIVLQFLQANYMAGLQFNTFWFHGKSGQTAYVIMGVKYVKSSERFTEITGQTGLYNIQAIDNIPSIITRGLLSNERASKINHVSIAMNEVQVRRDLVRIPNGLKLHQYANLQMRRGLSAILHTI